MALFGSGRPNLRCRFMGGKADSRLHASRSLDDPSGSLRQRLIGCAVNRCLLTASCRYDMLMLLVEENGFRATPPDCGSATGHGNANQ